MKENFCEVKYNKINEKWYCIIETALVNDFYESKLKKECLKYLFDKMKLYKMYIYIYDKKGNLIEKRKN